MAMKQAQVDLFDRVQRLVNGGKTGGGEALLKAQATSQTESTAKALLSGRKKKYNKHKEIHTCSEKAPCDRGIGAHKWN